ncbi:hypothetical protein [Ideonella margarita]|uniref:Uncharacterized protein n=1 Tax=Ideonella margarita TaxID=2984191 RepID=A0ABU9C870_9BURK
MPYSVILIKLLPREFEDDFLDGNLYLNTNVYFGAMDRTDAVRFDPHEGIDESLHVSKVEVQSNEGTWLTIPIAGPISTRSRTSNGLNVLCMFTVTNKPGDFFDDRNMAFGDRAVVVDNLIEFIARIKKAAVAVGRPVSHRPIEYVDRDLHSGPMGPFRKFSTHGYQNEFRFVLASGNGEPYRLQIGCIRDIAHSIPAAQVPAFWEAMRQVPQADT